MIGTWVAHIPWLQDHLGISKATLGLCLLCMAAGALVSMPVTGHFLDRLLGASSTHTSEGHGLALPTKPVLLIGGLCFLVMLAEGAIGDWSGIYLKHNTGANSATAALAFTGFSLGMATGRLGGDFINARLG